MIFHKSCHSCGLDTRIYNIICNRNTVKDYYFFIWDYCVTKTMISDDFFLVECNIDNTWNYALTYEDTSKTNIMLNSPKYGFGDYNISEYNDNQYIVKARSHIYSTERYGQCQLINKEDIDKIDKTKFIIQPILQNSKGEELNIYVFKNLNDGEIHFVSSMIISHDVNQNINRKKNKNIDKFCELTDVFGTENINNLKMYCKTINLDYGRIELINDITRGWCVIDINNSPGLGLSGNRFINIISDKYKSMFDRLV